MEEACASFHSTYSTYDKWTIDNCDWPHDFICKKPQQPVSVKPPDNGCNRVCQNFGFD